MPASTPRRPDPPPFQTNEYAPVITAVVMWAVAFVVLLVLHHRMAARGEGWWLWVGLSGFIIGLWGLTMLTLRRRSQRRRATRATVAAPDDAAADAAADAPTDAGSVEIGLEK
jgi:ABC-type nickel/cobalt efflux system permease component RcnA